MNTSNIYPALQLTDACNKRCSACLRTPGVQNHKISYKEFLLYLDDLKELSADHKIAYQFVTGGEPTIWRDDSNDVVDILESLTLFNRIDIITMPTNGKTFEDKGFANDFAHRLSQRISKKIVIGISIADYQNNFDGNVCTALDNILDACKDLKANAVPVILVTLSSDDSIFDRLKKKYPGVFKRVTALAPLGSASDMKDKCPSISLYGNDKTPLGSFLPHFKQDITGKLGISEKEFFEMPNSAIMDRISLYNNCGRSPFIDDRWHFCLPFRDNPEFDLCSIGEVRSDCLGKFIDKRPLIKSIMENGLLTAVAKYKDRLSGDSLHKLEEMYDPAAMVSVAYRGCMLCKEFYERGILRELDQVLQS